MRRLALLLAVIALPAAAQVRDFSCVGAEQLIEDAAVIPFAVRRDRVEGEALAPLEALVATAREEIDRNICVLGSPRRRKAGRRRPAASPHGARVPSRWSCPGSASSVTGFGRRRGREASSIRRAAQAQGRAE
jgi:hypothetical protein